ncbi:hypothetical protein AAVH_09607 [Aphelenchoides avenae]|nr:hypothetical protein AAVH_09607 [Aphelenchus avenae]
MYRDPLTLPACGHSVCSACVHQLIFNTTSPGNVVCPECRAHSPVTTNGFPRNYRLADMIATLEAAGYRETSQCSGCRSQVPNRRLRECKTCAPEGSLLLCADCSLQRHKDHDLVWFRRPPARPPPPLPGNPSVRGVAPNPVTIDERTPVVQDVESERQRNGASRQPIVDDGHHRRDERSQSTDCCSRFNAARLAAIRLIFILLAAVIVCLLYALMGPMNVLKVLAFGLVVYGGSVHAASTSAPTSS